MKTALVLGAGGFIGSHMVTRLKQEGYWVRGVDLKYPDFGKLLESDADEFVIADLRVLTRVEAVMRLDEDRVFGYYAKPFMTYRPFDEVYQFACQMGGAGYVFTGENDSDIMRDSVLINVNVLTYATTEKIFYSSSACIYPEEIQNEYHNVGLSEHEAYPGNPDSEYGWEKLFSERLYLAYARNKNIDIRIARFHNIFGPQGTYQGGREKAPAAICRKVIENETEVEIWGTGLQSRSFLYIDECIEGVRRLMESDYKEPINIGSDFIISINELAKMVIDISGKDLKIKNIEGPVGVNGRNSNNDLIKKVLNWSPTMSLKEGMEKTYNWIENEI